MRLFRLYPRLFNLPCKVCVEFQYDAKGVCATRVDENGNKVNLPRIKGTVPPCVWCPKIPEGEPKNRDHAIEMSDKNRKAFIHYQECRAVGAFPDDPIVRRNARIIREVCDAIDREDQMTFQATIGALAAVGSVGRGKS